ncbi:MFS transporter [Lacisediminihabitans sp.]|jgi:MFS family permease|uniref:MFS transporter n=1 Tax=Lacisediminihabitans sp. TaxID=2787631 RepID=UPI002F9359DC
MSMPRDYIRLWAASTISALGDGLRIAAIPLLAASATSDPFAISIVSAAGFLPWPVFGLLGGAISDRFERRRLMWMVNAARAIIICVSTIILLAEGSLPIALLALLAFLLGTAETVYDNAAIGILPQVLTPDLLPAGNSRLFTSQLSATQLIGPPLGGLLFVFGPSVPLTLDAISFVISATLIAFLSPTSRYPEQTPMNLRRDISEGIAWLWKSATLRTMVVLTVALSAASGALLAMLVVYAHDQLHTNSIGYGLLLGAFAVGSIAGALCTPKLMRTRPLREVLTGSIVAAIGVFAGLATTSTPAVAAGLLLLGAAVSTWNVASVTTRQRIVPNHLLGRVSSAYRASALTFTTIGALTAGILTGTTSITTTLWACAGLGLVGLLVRGRGLWQLH